jgi:ABC-type multidrug transport system ATPase subunit/pSer/pThr/pTyr-binding forkhead associated (FHA) protein
MSSCVSCGTPLRPGAKFCPRCGCRQPAIPIPAPARPPTRVLEPTKLLIRWPGGLVQEQILHKDVMTIGRDPASDIVLDFPIVSRHHARLEKEGGVYKILDLGSTNGTVVNGQRIKLAKVLANGDIVRIGDGLGNSISLTYQDVNVPVAVKRLDLGARTAMTIGRNPASDLYLDAPVVSWDHARITRRGNDYVLKDLGSTNGTFVNGLRVRHHVLQPGDVVQIGPYRLAYDQKGFTQVSDVGNVRLDAIRLCKEVGRGAQAKVILKDVSLCIYPKEFVALVGSSGAGKSSLMDALNGFRREGVTGRVQLNGADFYSNLGIYRAMLGYVPQDDIIHQDLPVANALCYAARLRLPADTTSQQIEDRIDQVLKDVGMEQQKTQVVSSLSGGQRKRVNISLELLTKPNLFFLDEPTSGLDPGLEKKMMGLLRRLSDEGRTIILVTHATANIRMCNHVAFMSQGRLCFFGPPNEALRFFGVPSNDFADIYSKLEERFDSNTPVPTEIQPIYDEFQHNPPLAQPAREPSLWKNLTSAFRKQDGAKPGIPAALLWEEYFKRSPYYQHYVTGRLNQPASPLPFGAASPQAQGTSESPRAAAWRQFWILTQRYFELVVRDKLSLFILLAVMPIIGLLLVLIAGQHDLVGEAADVVRNMDTYKPFFAAQKLLFMLALASVLLGTFGAAYELVKERAIYRRERMINLQLLPYILSKVAVLFLFSLAQSWALLWVLSRKVELPAEGALLPGPLEMYITLVLATLASTLMGLLISALASSRDMVIYIILLVLFVQILFAGAIFELPKSVEFISKLTTTRWALDALGSTVDLSSLADQHKMGGRPMPLEKEDFPLPYTHKAGHVLGRWVILMVFAGAFGGLTCWVQMRKDKQAR